MKKNYSSPDMRVVTMKVHQILSTMSLHETTKGFGSSLGRSNDIDDEDDEDF